MVAPSNYNTKNYFPNSHWLKEYGRCAVDACKNPRIKDGKRCIVHTSDFDDGNEFNWVYGYVIKCFACPHIQYAQGTREQERVTRLMGLPPCPNCSGLQYLEDDDRLIGRVAKGA